MHKEKPFFFDSAVVFAKKRKYQSLVRLEDFQSKKQNRAFYQDIEKTQYCKNGTKSHIVSGFKHNNAVNR